MKSSALETWVGALVLFVAAGFLVFAYSRTDIETRRTGYTLNATFGRVDGISVGSDVRLAGLKVGVVSSQSLNGDTYEANVALAIDPSVRVPDDSIAKVTLDGLLGGSHISIEPGGSFEYLEDGDEIAFTQGSVDILGLATRAFLNNDDNDAAPAGEGL
ncbi:MAG: outer membrane lipid asymmetry maintenance protein MlaD [Pseudomonadota bacterium]